MSPEPTAPTTPEGQAPEGAATGLEPTTPESTTPDPEGQKPEGKTFDEGYVKQLRTENAAARRELKELKEQLTSLQDRDKTDQERLAERVAASEQRASAAEGKLIRHEVVAQRSLDVSLVDALAGTTREEIEASADAFVAAQAKQPKSPTFDGGARQTPEATLPGDQAHNKFLANLLRPGQSQ